MMKNTTRNASLLAVLATMSGLLSFVAGIVLLVGGTVNGALGGTGTGISVMLGAAMFAIGIVGLVVGYGFWSVRPWARRAAIMFYSSGVVVHLASVALAGAGILSIAVPVALAAVVIWFLFQPAVKATFTPAA